MTSFSYDTIERMPYLQGVRRVVVKLGSEALVTKEGRLNYRIIERKTHEIADAYNSGMDIAIVTSGAIALGSQGKNPQQMTMAQKQLAAAIGQPRLMEEYNRLLNQDGLSVAQLLLLSSTFENPAEFVTIRRVCNEAFDSRYALPTTNYNDSLSSEQIEKFDNDTIGAKKAVTIGADLYIICIAGTRNGGVVEGFYDRDPDDPAARLIKVVYKIDDEVRSFAIEKEGPIITRGGYSTKNTAAQIATHAGISVIAVNVNYSLDSVLAGEEVGTFYVPRPRKLVTPDTPDDVAFRLAQELFSEVERTG